MKKWFLWTMICLTCVTLLLYSGKYFTYTGNKVKLNIPIRISQENEYVAWEEQIMSDNPDYDKLAIFVDVYENTLTLFDYEKNEILREYNVVVDSNYEALPIGTWHVEAKGKWREGFGPRWMGLNVPWGNYGIHGLTSPSNDGIVIASGCIQMGNADVEELYSLVKIGTTVFVHGGVFGSFDHGFRTIKPGDRGADVYAVQKQMKQAGYYPYEIDGIYGENMKALVKKFRKDNRLQEGYHIDEEFYNTLGIELFE